MTLLWFSARPYGADSSADELAAQAAPYIPQGYRIKNQEGGE